MSRITDFRALRIQALFWLGLFLYEWLPGGSLTDHYEAFFIGALCYLPIVMAATYFTISVLVERLLFKGKNWQFAGLLTLSLIVFGLLRRTVSYYVMYPKVWPEKTLQPFFIFPKITIDAVYIHLLAALGAFFYIVRKMNAQQRASEQLMREKVAAQLELLKSQVQPHFIFNTLNNIYMLSLKGSPQTSEMVYRLSSLLSYMLYDSKRNMIELDKEIDYIKNYINLEKIRYGERLDVQLNVFNTTRSISVPPLFFLPLVENAFKHGVSNSVEESWIHIDITVKNNVLIFKIENSIKDATEAAESRESTGFGNGLGLENLQKRLEIIYPSRHELKFMKEEYSCLVVLKIDLEPSMAWPPIFAPDEAVAAPLKSTYKLSLGTIMKALLPFMRL